MIEPLEAVHDAPLASEAPAVIPLPGPLHPCHNQRSGSNTRKRRHVEQFRTDDAEHEELRQRAYNAHLSVGAYCRERTLSECGPRSRRSPPSLTPANVKLLWQYFIELQRQGNNLNQLARAMNELLLIVQTMNNDRLARIIAATLEQNRAIYRDMEQAARNAARLFE
jgi:hypothetical protein